MAMCDSWAQIENVNRFLELYIVPIDVYDVVSEYA